MAQFTTNIPDAQLPNAKIALQEMGYEEDIYNPDFNPEEPVDPIDNPATIPNPQSYAEFFNEMVFKTLRRYYAKRKIREYVELIKNDL